MIDNNTNTHYSGAYYNNADDHGRNGSTYSNKLSSNNSKKKHNMNKKKDPQC